LRENKVKGRKLKKMNEVEDLTEEPKHETKTIKLEDKRDIVKKQQIFEKRDGERTTADDDKDPTQQLKDRFITEDIDELFGTANDVKIAETDIPERLQIKLNGRFKATDEELERESEWIFNFIIESLDSSKDASFALKMAEIKKKIKKVLTLFRNEYCDISFITRYRQNELIPELEPKHVWRIFELDIEYGKF